MKKRTVALLMAMVLVFGIAVGGTLAFLTDITGKVSNTFTVGDIQIDLKEHDKDNNEVTTRDDYKVIPGKTEAKDPFVTVKKGSEPCYVYVMIENNLGTAATLNIQSGWTSVNTAGNRTLYVYGTAAAPTKVDAASADQVLKVFTEVTYASALSTDEVSALNGKTINVVAYAHQANELGSTTPTDIQNAAWTALDAKLD